MSPSDKARALEMAVAAGRAMPRLPMPQAVLDPAFLACLDEAVATPELIEQFDRLKGTSLSGGRSPIEQMVDRATGKLAEDAAEFSAFVHDCVYLRLPDEVIGALRLSRMGDADVVAQE